MSHPRWPQANGPARSLHALIPKDGRAPMYAQQQSMPKLPVPPLAETIPKYLRTLEPLGKPDQLVATRQHAAVFLASDQAQQLQRRLEARVGEEQATSWLWRWWRDWAYMGFRETIVFNVSYSFVFQRERRAEHRAAATRAARLTQAALQFRQLVVDEQLHPPAMKGRVLSMDQYQWLFNTCRVPATPNDTTRVTPTTNTDIIVIRKNRFFLVSTHDDAGRRLSTAQLQTQYERIMQLADKRGPAVGALTSAHRDVWADVRSHLVALSAKNRQSLDQIESAMFLVCLDDTRPEGLDALSRACWHGDGQNRFYDKPVQLIVFENGEAGHLGEHSMMDGTTVSHLCEWMLSNLAADHIDHGDATERPALFPRELDFDLDPTVQTAIQGATRAFDALVAQHAMHVLHHTAYGGAAIKQWKLSPDAFCQMAFQLAYYTMTGTCRPTYESASTRRFAYGRTETGRALSKEALAFCEAMTRAGTSAQDRMTALRAAVAQHVAFMAEAGENRGVDRHLLGLKLSLAPDEPVPALLSDELFEYSKTWYLSTSNISSEWYQAWGFGQVVPDGLGLAYIIQRDALVITIAGLQDHMDVPQFKKHLAAAFDQMAQLCDVAASRAKL
ncbi:hypothetical protein CXG81DRAFT_26448 [Caulochytrium protostelioides]|nr:hypothetical protein CXG81DRAFT_26448 [Caulochytrium protostelioides]|eukprot:RKP00863.1 hypothetical protein CXG81DRAFT_26448 [Caulochytrium protostelioides]